MKRCPNQKSTFLTICCALGSVISGAQAAKVAVKNGAETIIYSARYYSSPDSSATSHSHVYSITARGGKPRQLTFGQQDESMPRISPDNRTLAFTRTRAAKSEICALDLRTNRLKIVLSAADNSYINALEWSPVGNTLAVQREGKGNVALYLIDFPSLRQRRFSGLNDWAWRPDSSQVRISDKKGTRLWDVAAQRETPLPYDLAATIWLNRDECARVVTAPDAQGQKGYNSLAKSVEFFPLDGQKPRRVALQPVQGLLKIDNDNYLNGEALEFDGRTLLLPIPHQKNAVMLVANDSTSSGANFAFTRFDARSGQTRFLARGTRLSWARDAQRFAVVDYHDTHFYDTLPNGHKRVVYTTRLMLGDGKNALRPLVSGLVVVNDCDWER